MYARRSGVRATPGAARVLSPGGSAAEQVDGDGAPVPLTRQRGLPRVEHEHPGCPRPPARSQAAPPAAIQRHVDAARLERAQQRDEQLGAPPRAHATRSSGPTPNVWSCPASASRPRLQFAIRQTFTVARQRQAFRRSECPDRHPVREPLRFIRHGRRNGAHVRWRPGERLCLGMTRGCLLYGDAEKPWRVRGSRLAGGSANGDAGMLQGRIRDLTGCAA